MQRTDVLECARVFENWVALLSCYLTLEARKARVPSMVAKRNLFLREWALWGTRNLCETDDTIRKEIEVLAPEKILEAEELMKQGLKAELNPKTGKPRVVSIEKTSKVELETMTALGGSPAATRNEQNVVRIETKKTSPDNNKDEAEEEFQIPKNWKVAEL
mmetsp:Transcript_3382/g.10391  ORF Transcript_3382/g.10391 Transcript_3382/m.10391 type:complete len:161 (+) Transcript_3382:1744-2226(+)